ncbi:MAG: hypothetical protein BWY07_01863 [Candidatus Hydrogenedentes bacterium ADurb.Bin170]|nr:MAG: hypothetical protein BWY07_01863 [Candidatus Hydrogenedentes bacterium ADurb.Bin170]
MAAPLFICNNFIGTSVRIGELEHRCKARPVVAAVPDPIHKSLVVDMRRQTVPAFFQKRADVHFEAMMCKMIGRCRTLYRKITVNIKLNVVICRNQQNSTYGRIRKRYFPPEKCMYVRRAFSLRRRIFFPMKKIQHWHALKKRITKPRGLTQGGISKRGATAEKKADEQRDPPNGPHRNRDRSFERHAENNPE